MALFTATKVGCGVYTYRGFKIRRDYSMREKRTVWKYYAADGRLRATVSTLRTAKNAIDIAAVMGR